MGINHVMLWMKKSRLKHISLGHTRVFIIPKNVRCWPGGDSVAKEVEHGGNGYNCNHSGEVVSS
jgi:hypothetical protein